VAGGAYLAAQALDLRLRPARTDDLAIHGRLFSADPRRWRPIGALLHLSFGAFLGALYAGRPRRRLTRPTGPTAHLPPWAAGVLFLQLENALLYPLLALLHRLHPAWRTGLLESYYRPLPAAQQVWRHAVFGAVLGALLGRPVAHGPRSVPCAR
jgi:hypothetical protein